MKFDLYVSNVRAKNNNVYYKNLVSINSPEDLKKAAMYDHVCALYKDYYRDKDNFIKSNVLPMDCDNDHSEKPEEWITPESLSDLFGSVSFVVVFSRNNMKQKGSKAPRPRFHIYFEIPEYTDAVKYKALKHALFRLYPFFDKSCLDSARFLYGVKEPDVALWHDGFDTIDDIVEVTQEDINNIISSDSLPNTEYKKSQNRTAEQEVIPEGARNNTLLRYAERVLTRLGVCEDAFRLFVTRSNNCIPPLEEAELNSIWSSAKNFYLKRISQKEGYKSPEQYRKDFPPATLKPDDYSDIGQAKILVREYGDELKFTEGTDYIRYDGQRWIESSQLSIGAAEEFLDLQLEEATEQKEGALSALESLGISRTDVMVGGKKLIKALNPKHAKVYVAYLAAKSYYEFVMQRRNMKYINSALDAAKPFLEIDIACLDSNEFLLNTPGITYDLRKGMNGAQEPNADDLITKQCAVTASNEGSQIWEDALKLFFCNDSELISYVQEIVGLAAIGKVYAEALIISYGEGSNGKSTFWNTISRVLGTYSGGISADALTVGCKRNVKPEMAELMGKRLVIAAELEEGVRLNTSIIKQLCSTDEIQGEKKYKSPFKFTPTHTLVLYTNHLPKVGANDAGTWRRLIVIPFNAKIQGSGDIKNYSDYLFKNAGPAVLKWIIEGAQKAIQHDFHLKFPKCVQDAISAYRENNDWLGAFLEERCEIDPSYFQKSGELYQTYRAYCLGIGEYIRSTTDFYSALEIAGFEKKRTNAARFIKGLRLKEEFLN